MNTGLITTKNSVKAVDNFELGYSSDIMAALTEELGENAAIPYERVKFPSAGATIFERPGENEDEPENVPKLEGVILFAHDINIYYATPYDGKNNPPDCSSLDGKVGIEKETGVYKDCSTCPFNKFGSGKNGGKACKNKKRIYLLPSGAVLPIILTLPPTSIKEYTNYVGRQVLLKGLRTYEIVTQVSLRADKSASSGFRYSKGVFKCLGRVNDELITDLEKLRDEFKNTYMDYSITEEDVVSGEAAASSSDEATSDDSTISTSETVESLDFEEVQAVDGKTD